MDGQQTMTDAERLELLGRTVSDLEEQIKRLQEQLDGLGESVEHRFIRQYERVERVDDDARERDRNLEYSIDSAQRRADEAMGEARRAASGSRW